MKPDLAGPALVAGALKAPDGAPDSGPRWLPSVPGVASVAVKGVGQATPIR